MLYWETTRKFFQLYIRLHHCVGNACTIQVVLCTVHWRPIRTTRKYGP